MINDLASRRAARRRRWKRAASAALPVVALAVVPLLFFPAARGRDWRGEFPHTHSDEVAYAAYLNALLDGRPRRSDPYTGRDDSPHARARENIFSVQFFPPLALAAAGRLLRLDAARLFVALTCLAALASALALFRLLLLLLRDGATAAAGTLAVLCLASSYRVVEHLLRLSAGVDFLPFLRRYQPAASFPLLFVFVALVWLMLTRERRRTTWLAAGGAGATLAALVFSYFYLWTAAAAWLAVLAALWLARRPADRRRAAARFAVVFAALAAALAPYFLLLSRRAATADESQLVAATRLPDLLRFPVVVGLLACAALYYGARRGRLRLSDPLALFAAACALAPLAVFNQQIITGRSLQPVHYSLFSANYLAALGAFLCAAALLRNRPATRNDDEAARRGGVDGATRAAALPRRWLLALAAVSLASGAAEAALVCRVRYAGNVLRDEARPVALRLAELGRAARGADDARNAAANNFHAADADTTDAAPNDSATVAAAETRADGTLDTRSLVFAPEYTVADYLPTVAPQPQLWSPHLYVNTALAPDEYRERLAHYLYFSDADFSRLDPRRPAAPDGRTRFLFNSLLGFGRLNPELSAAWREPAPAETESALRAYESFAASFTRERAARLPLTYVVLAAPGSGFSNLERWYELGAGERHGNFILYRVRLK